MTELRFEPESATGVCIPDRASISLQRLVIGVAEADDEDEDANQSLSKQASAVWNKMSEAEKRPYVERAKLEKAAHEAKYPHYRYKPVRHNSAIALISQVL